MSDILSRLRDAYTENPASALKLLPELFQAEDDNLIVELRRSVMPMPKKTERTQCPPDVRALIHYLCNLEYTGEPCAASRSQFNTWLGAYIKQYGQRMMQKGAE